MKYTLIQSTKFKKDLKPFKNSTEKSSIINFLSLLEEGGFKNISSIHRPHKLIGNYKGDFEAHILNDLLIIWNQQDEPNNKIRLVRIGSHSELF